MDEIVSRNTLERFVENVEELKKYCTPENNYGGLMVFFVGQMRSSGIFTRQ